MRFTIRTVLAAGVGLVLAGLAAASCWFWFTPVGLNNYINKITLQSLLRSPESLTSLGLLDDTLLDFHGHKLTAFTRQQELDSLAFLRRSREGLNRYGPQGLEGQDRLTWAIAAWMMDDQIAQASFERGGYRLTQLDGVTVQLPQFLTDVHPIRSHRGAQRYLKRLEAFGDILQQAHQRVAEDRDHGVVPPDFIVRRVLEQLRAFAAAAPADHLLVSSLHERLRMVESVSAAQAVELGQQAQDILRRRILPGYQQLIELHEALLKHTDSRNRSARPRRSNWDNRPKTFCGGASCPGTSNSSNCMKPCSNIPTQGQALSAYRKDARFTQPRWHRTPPPA